MIKDKIIVFVPHKIVSEANNFDNRWKKQARKESLHWAVKAALSQHSGEFPLPCLITFERIGKKMLDDDNLAYAFKAARDMVAKVVIERTEPGPVKPIGQYDSDSRLNFKYAQRSNKDELGHIHQIGFYIIIEETEKIDPQRENVIEQT